MAVPLLDISRQHQPLLPQLKEAFAELVRTGSFILGPTVERFEKHLATYCGASAAIGLSSGTDALLAAMMALGIGRGDQVITTPFTFFATAGCISRLGATPVFVDIDPDTFNIDARLIEPAVTRRTRAIIPVHLYGLPADMRPIMQLARTHGLTVIEDAAQAIGAKDHDQLVGSIGEVGALSFYPTKNLAALGDAGACVTSDAELADRLRHVRVHGSHGGYRHDIIGGNFRLDAIQAAMLDIKLAHLDEWTAARRRHAGLYDAALQSSAPLASLLRLPTASAHAFHVYNQYTVRVLDGRRDALQKHLSAAGIGNRVYYPLPLHLQPCFAHLGYQAGQFPQAEQAAAQVLSLPIFPEMTEGQQDEVIAAVREFASRG